MLKFIFTALIIIAPIIASSAMATPFMVKGTGKITWVADGDTFRIKPDDPLHFAELRGHAEEKQKTVTRDLKVSSRFQKNGTFLTRVGNIDTEESVHKDSNRNTAAGAKASDYAKQNFTGQNVHFACWDIDHWGRPVCTAWTTSWEYGTHMIESGYTPYITKFGRHPLFHEEYTKAAQKRN